MKINSFFLLSLGVLMSTGCMKSAQELQAERTARVEAVETMADYQVPVKEGMTTIVRLGADTLVVTQQAASVSVPRYALQDGSLEVLYSTDEIYTNYAASGYWHYLSFEDSRAADYDYNDLVIHCRIKNEGTFNKGSWTYRHVIGVQPVALGGSRKLRLGILYKENSNSTTLSEKILCEDVRAELFNGNAAFPINTDPKKEIKQVSNVLAPKFEFTNTELNFKVVWFIETGDDRFYAATTNFNANRSYEMLSADGLPYGISLTKKWDYPVEKCSARDAYPGFDRWIQSGNEKLLLDEQVRESCFPASINKLWDYVD